MIKAFLFSLLTILVVSSSIVPQTIFAGARSSTSDNALTASVLIGIKRVSVTSDGSEANNESRWQCISDAGRFVAFDSIASNLVPQDTNGYGDVFVHDQMTGETRRVSVSSDGIEGNGNSFIGSISSDGRFIAFVSEASNLVPGDTNGLRDIFVHDCATSQTTRVSVASDGTQANLNCYIPDISSDGRFVAFQSHAFKLVPDDTNESEDVFVHDRLTEQTSRVSIASDGTQAEGSGWGSFGPSISADGRFVAFASAASNLVAGDTNREMDIFVHDRATGQTVRVSVASDGTQGNNDSYYPDISGDGRFIAFISSASNLVTSDTNGYEDIFVHDRTTGENTIVSVAFDGSQGNAVSYCKSISADGRFVVFGSEASNLVPNDTNGCIDVFVHNRQTRETKRVSVAADGSQANRGSGLQVHKGSISADGKFIAFASSASNLIGGDTNGQQDVFVVELAPPLPPPDTTPPATVTDLAALNATVDSITLTWRAPGDDGSTGTSATYDIRYSTSDITEANWASATQCIGEPAPQPAGSKQTFIVMGLSPGTAYYFALKTADEVPNWSGLSNVAKGRTLPVITVTSPNGGESWAIGSRQRITWTSSNVTGNVRIEISRDNGTTWKAIFSSIPNDGSQSWVVTGPATTQARVKIISISGPSVYDISDNNFTITRAPKAKVCIDPGHSPDGSFPKPLEYAINKGVAEKLKSKLEVMGIAVYLTNPDDDPLARAAFANTLKPDIFVSLHCNALEGFKDTTPVGRVRGTEVWIYDDADSPEQVRNELHLAVLTVHGLSKEIGSRLRKPCEKLPLGVKEKCPPWSAGIPILRGINVCPSVLLEMEFYDYGMPVSYKGVNYPNMLALMNTEIWREDATRGIADGIIRYFGQR